ncbi:MAG: alpha/beta hydrolase [Acidimicrobiia bacterium]
MSAGGIEVVQLSLAAGTDAPGPLSALAAFPANGAPPKAVVWALHGAGMHAGYWHATADPDLSLLTLGATLGFTVVAIDRPGHGASTDWPDDWLTRERQAEALHAARDTFAATHETGTGFFVIAHSYGMRVAFTMAAHPRGRELIGLDGSGSGLRFANAEHMPAPGTPVAERRHNAQRNPWGPRHLYPRTVFSRKALPLAPMPAAQSAETWSWPDTLPKLAADIEIPVRLTYGEHETFYLIDDEHLDEIRALFVKSPRVVVERQPYTGHNISLSNVARVYHLKALAFAEECIVAARLGAF